MFRTSQTCEATITIYKDIHYSAQLQLAQPCFLDIYESRRQPFHIRAERQTHNIQIKEEKART